MSGVNEQVTLRPGESDAPAPKEASAEAPPKDTVEEKLRYAIFDACKQKPEFSGRYCNLCADTTAHFRLRGNNPDYVKTANWMCTTCFMPGGYVHEIVKQLLNRQERPQT